MQVKHHDGDVIWQADDASLKFMTSLSSDVMLIMTSRYSDVMYSFELFEAKS